MIYGLLAALTWGAADFFAALTSRRIGSTAAAGLSLVIGVVMLGLLVLVLRPVVPLHAGFILLSLGGSLGALGYFTFYRGLQLGPLAIVSPVSAAYSAVTIALSILLRHESVTELAGTGIGLTLLGVVLSSTNVREVRAHLGESMSAGLPFALLSMFCLGGDAFIIGFFSKQVGWLLAIFLPRITSSCVIVLFLASSGGLAPLRRMGQASLALVILVAALDVIGGACFARGSQVGLLSIVTAASSSYPAIPVLAGILYFRERLVPNQVMGIVAIIAGLVLLGTGAR